MLLTTMHLEKAVSEINKRLENVEIVVIENLKILKELKESQQLLMKKTLDKSKSNRENSLNKKELDAICSRSQEMNINSNSKGIPNGLEIKDKLNTDSSKYFYQTSQKKFALKNMDQNMIKFINLTKDNNTKLNDYKRITIKLKENTIGNTNQFHKTREIEEFIQCPEKHLESTQYFKNNNKEKGTERLAQTLRLKRNSTSFCSFPKEINNIFSPARKLNKCRKTIIVEDIDFDFTDKKYKSQKALANNRSNTKEISKINEIDNNLKKLTLKSDRKEFINNKKINNKERSIASTFNENRNSNLKLAIENLSLTRNNIFSTINFQSTQNYKSMNINRNSEFQCSVSNFKEFKFEKLEIRLFNLIMEYLGKECKSIIILNKTILRKICKIKIEKCKEKMNILTKKKTPLSDLNIFKGPEIDTKNFKFSSKLIESINQLDHKLSLDLKQVELNEQELLIFNSFKQVGKCCLFKFDSKTLKVSELKSKIY